MSQYEPVYSVCTFIFIFYMQHGIGRQVGQHKTAEMCQETNVSTNIHDMNMYYICVCSCHNMMAASFNRTDTFILQQTAQCLSNHDHASEGSTG